MIAMLIGNHLPKNENVVASQMAYERTKIAATVKRCSSRQCQRHRRAGALGASPAGGASLAPATPSSSVLMLPLMNLVKSAPIAIARTTRTMKSGRVNVPTQSYRATESVMFFSMMGPRMNPISSGGRGQRYRFISIPSTAPPSTMAIALTSRVSWKAARSDMGMMRKPSTGYGMSVRRAICRVKPKPSSVTNRFPSPS